MGNDNDLGTMLRKLPRENLVNLMYTALSEMQAYNGKSPTFCILESVGAHQEEQLDGSYKVTLPSFKDAKDITD